MRCYEPKLEDLTYLDDGFGTIQFGMWVDMNEILNEGFGIEAINNQADEQYYLRFVDNPEVNAPEAILTSISYDLAGIDTDTNEVYIKVTAVPQEM